MKKGRFIQGIERGDAERITRDLHKLLLLLERENGDVLRFVREEKRRIIARKRRLNKFPKKCSLELIIPWIVDSTLFRSSLTKKMDEDFERVITLKQYALQQGKQFEYLIENLASMSADKVYAEMHDFISKWYLRNIPKSERDRIIQFHFDVRFKNVCDIMIELGVAATQM